MRASASKSSGLEGKDEEVGGAGEAEEWSSAIVVRLLCCEGQMKCEEYR